jgi:hypothetical protein
VLDAFGKGKRYDEIPELPFYNTSEQKLVVLLWVRSFIRGTRVCVYGNVSFHSGTLQISEQERFQSDNNISVMLLFR